MSNSLAHRALRRSELVRVGAVRREALPLVLREDGQERSKEREDDVPIGVLSLAAIHGCQKYAKCGAALLQDISPIR